MALRKPRPAKERGTPQAAERAADSDREPARGPRFRASLRNEVMPIKHSRVDFRGRGSSAKDHALGEMCKQAAPVSWIND